MPPVAVSAGLFVILRRLADPFALAIPLIILVNALMALPFALRQLEPPLILSAERYGRLADSLGIGGFARIRLVDWPLLARPLAAALAVAVALSLGDLGVAAFFGSGNIVTLPLLLYRAHGRLPHGGGGVGGALPVAPGARPVPRRAKMVGRPACSKLADLTLDYPGFHACYTLSVPAGALCGLIGPSGGGKTTLLHAIAGFETPNAGTLRFAGRDLLAAHALGAAALDPVPGPQSLPASDGGAECRARHQTRRCASTPPSMPPWRARWSGSGSPASAAVAPRTFRRSAAARCARPRARAPRPLMLLDEPFGGLDPGLRREMVALVDTLRRDEGLTVLVSIHTPEDIGDAAELMAFVADGRVLAAAPPQEILGAGFHPAIDRYLGR